MSLTSLKDSSLTIGRLAGITSNNLSLDSLPHYEISRLVFAYEKLQFKTLATIDGFYKLVFGMCKQR